MISSYRITTGGVLRNYRSNLMKSYGRLNDSMTKVLTQRQFNSYAEDPAAASKAWQLRRSYWRNSDQINNTNTLISRFETAFTAVDAICDGDIEHQGLDEIDTALRGLNDATGSARKDLGLILKNTADSIVQNMNAKYADEFVFAAADGLNVPFSTGENGELLYRGINVDTPNPLTETEFEQMKENGQLDNTDTFLGYKESFKAKYGISYDQAVSDYAKLDAMTKETTYVDIGLGFQENKEGDFISSSGYNSSLCGLDFLGYGVDEDGDKLNIVSLMRELGDIFSNCDEKTGRFLNEDGTVDTATEERASQLTTKLQRAIGECTKSHAELSAETKYLNDNLGQLKNTSDVLNEQIMELESINPADAIKDMNWANYCYQAALKIGNSILSQSLIDYMN